MRRVILIRKVSNTFLLNFFILVTLESFSIQINIVCLDMKIRSNKKYLFIYFFVKQKQSKAMYIIKSNFHLLHEQTSIVTDH